METLCYLIRNTLAAGMALQEMAGRIPCFVTCGRADGGSIEVTIECREFDAPFVEEALADYV